MEPTPVPRTPVSQRIGAAAAAESKADADAGETVHAQQDCVDTWSTDKIETFAPAAEQMIVVRNVGKPHWKVFRTMSILLLTSRGAAWDWLLYAAGHKETGVGNQRLIRTIDGVGGYTGLSFFNDQNNMYTAKIHSIMLKLLPEGPWRHQWTRIYEHYMEGGNNKANGHASAAEV